MATSRMTTYSTTNSTPTNPTYAYDTSSTTYAYETYYDVADQIGYTQFYCTLSTADQNMYVWVQGAVYGLYDGFGRIDCSWNSGTTYYNMGMGSVDVPTASPVTAGLYSFPYMRGLVNRNTTRVRGYYDSGLEAGARAEWQINDIIMYYESPLSAVTNPSCTPGVEKNTISWTAHGSATKYYLFYATSTGVSWSSSYIDVGNVTNYEHSPLTPGIQVFYKVAAYYNYGPGYLSTEVSGTPLSAVSVPPVMPSSGVFMKMGQQVFQKWERKPGTTLYIPRKDKWNVR